MVWCRDCVRHLADQMRVRGHCVLRRRWNPVQGGSWQNGPPKLLASSMGAASLTVASVPRNWGGQQLLDEVLMVTETELHPNVVKVGRGPRRPSQFAGTVGVSQQVALLGEHQLHGYQRLCL
jgi:hypothetical protein